MRYSSSSSLKFQQINYSPAHSVHWLRETLVTLFERAPIIQLLTDLDYDLPDSLGRNQLTLFD